MRLSEKKIPKVTMSQEVFEKSVNEALALGYTEFELTPCAGEVFMDRNFYKKLGYLENTFGVKHYSFFTNLTALDENRILELKKLKKLKKITISIYGHDEASFVKITQRDASTYRRLLSNLKTVLKHIDEFSFSIDSGFRSEFKALEKGASSDLLDLIDALKKAGVGVASSHGIYNNWGGFVTQNDVKGLDVIILDNDFQPKRGACSKLFDSVQVTASGVVNACNCRDVDSQLKIGDISNTPLSEIMDPSKNPRYKKIIDEQESNIFGSLCKNCDFYRSIYHQPKFFRKLNISTVTADEFMSHPFPRDRQ